LRDLRMNAGLQESREVITTASVWCEAIDAHRFGSA
jgi:hypothetical protein